MERVILPDLKKKEGIGILKELTVVGRKMGGVNSPKCKEKKAGGNVLDRLVFLTPRAIPVNIQSFPELLKNHEKPDIFYFPCGDGKKTNAYGKIVLSLF